MRLLFSVTLFLSAALMFMIEPMIGKMLLPLVGGAPAVWNTCIVFFQATLLLGYLYAHFAPRWLGARRQAWTHVGLLALPVLLLPIVIGKSVPPTTNPVPWLLSCLATSVGLPFFVVSASAPLMQRWFARSQTGNPYALYAASNAGSLIGLLGYPLFAERFLSLRQQGDLWKAGYVVVAILVAVCALFWSRPTSENPPEESAPHITWRQRGRWILLAFVPSSLMLGVTTYVSTDVAAVPLLWVVPLALYLVTFVLVFAHRPIWPPAWLGRALSLVVVVLLVAISVGATYPAGFLIPLHLLAFFAAAWICHAELAKDRPAPARLTEFYLWLSAGGVLGGAFNSLLAPLVFNRVLEYPLALALACALRPASEKRNDWRAWIAPVSVGVLVVAMILVVERIGLAPGRATTLLIFGIPALVAYRFVREPRRYGVALGTMVVAGTLYGGVYGRALHIERNFFGVLRVADEETTHCRILVHGNTLHGRQSLDPTRRGEPLGYYHRAGPMGQVFDMVTAHEVAVVGLGAGALACYARPDQRWTFYEIDPAVERIARDAHYFTYLQDCRAGAMQVVLGDARLRLAEASDGKYELIVLDAFSSDAIPVHLLTREALQLYAAKMTRDGLLAFHITNRCLDLRPVVANLAAEAGFVALCRDDVNVTDDGQDPSRWVVLTRQTPAFSADPRWQLLPVRREFGLWTDDFSNILSVLHWR